MAHTLSRSVVAALALVSAVVGFASAAEPMTPKPKKEPTPEEKALLEKLTKARPELATMPAPSEGKATELLKDKTEQVRAFGLIQVLLNPGKEKAALPKVIELTGDREPQVTRLLAIAALGAYGEDAVEAIPNLSEILSDTDRLARAEAAKALAQMGRKAKDALPKLTDALNDKDPEVVKLAARAIGGIQSDAKEAVPALVKLYEQSKDPSVRASALYGLGGVGPECADVAVPLMTAALKERNHEIRGWAAASLGRMGPAAKAAIPQLKITTGDSDPDVREAARAALKAIQ